MTDATSEALRLIEETTRIALEGLHADHRYGSPEPIEIDSNGIMHGVGVEYINSPKRSPLATPDGDIDGVVWHWTATRGVGAPALARRISTPGGRAASWHVCIDREGNVVQSVPLKFGSWHAGSDTAALFARDTTHGGWHISRRGRGANAWSCGIELENVGQVKIVGKDWLGWPFGLDQPTRSPVVPDSEVITIDGRGYHKFPAEQVASAKRVLSSLVRRYALRRENCAWGHCQIDPARRDDPGPLWMGGLGGRPPQIGTAAGGILHTMLDEIYQ